MLLLQASQLLGFARRWHLCSLVMETSLRLSTFTNQGSQPPLARYCRTVLRLAPLWQRQHAGTTTIRPQSSRKRTDQVAHAWPPLQGRASHCHWTSSETTSQLRSSWIIKRNLQFCPGKRCFVLP